MNGVEQSPSDPWLPSDPTIDHALATAKSSHDRSRNFIDEDILLVLVWLNVGMNSIQGVDQTQGTFWERMHACMHVSMKTRRLSQIVQKVFNAPLVRYTT